MSKRPARFTQAELGRAIREAKREGMAVRVRDGEIYIVPSVDKPPLPVVQVKEIVL